MIFSKIMASIPSTLNVVLPIKCSKINDDVLLVLGLISRHTWTNVAPSTLKSDDKIVYQRFIKNVRTVLHEKSFGECEKHTHKQIYDDAFSLALVIIKLVTSFNIEKFDESYLLFLDSYNFCIAIEFIYYMLTLCNQLQSIHVTCSNKIDPTIQPVESLLDVKDLERDDALLFDIYASRVVVEQIASRFTDYYETNDVKKYVWTKIENQESVLKLYLPEINYVTTKNVPSLVISKMMWHLMCDLMKIGPADQSKLYHLVMLYRGLSEI